MSDLRIRELDAATRVALARLFERPGDPRWCWCMEWRRPGSSWANADPAANRAEMARACGARIAEGCPVRADGARTPSAACRGTLGMFGRAGLSVAAETSSRPAPDLSRVAVRRALDPA